MAVRSAAKPRGHVAAAVITLAVSACAARNSPPDAYLLVHSAIPASSSHVTVCNRAGCEETAQVQFSQADWRRIEQLFTPRAADSEAERSQIGSAIALMERLAGPQAGTFDDQPAGQGVFRGTRQLDCVAETNNTTVYLLLLEHQGLLLRHRTGYPQHRGLLSLQAPHNTAVLIENATGKRFAVDAYFHANGQAPEIVPLDTWSRGYTPQDR
jgi:hypothetical protein